MPEISMMPLMGINNVAEESALQRKGDERSLALRDAVNVHITAAGKLELKPSPILVSTEKLKSLWQSPLHGDVFAIAGNDWVRVDPDTWSYEVLLDVGGGDASFEVLNNLVCMAVPSGIYCYDGQQAKRLTMDTPAVPFVMAGEGSLEAGTYGVAVSWLRGGHESGVSMIRSLEVPQNSSLAITFPMIMDTSITGVRLYVTRQNGGELLRAGDYSAATSSVEVPLLSNLGAPAQFQYKSPMPSGDVLRLWRGRLLTAKANVLRFSQALAYHLHDERHDFIQMPQRITFVLPVDGGIWVGQVDHVAFLDGASPDALTITRKSSKKPVPNSAILVDSDALGGDISQGGAASAMWLSENGYVVGTASGQIIELHAGKLKGITASAGTTVVLDRRAYTVLT